MSSVRKEQICELLKGIESGDPAAVAVVNEEKYIQHNPQTHEGSEGLAALFKRLSKTSVGPKRTEASFGSSSRMCSSIIASIDWIATSTGSGSRSTTPS